MNYFNINDADFWGLSSKFNQNVPFSRIMSIALMEGCRSIVFSESVFHGEDINSCTQNDNHQACINCSNYLKDLSTKEFGYKIKEKHCYKIYFFSRDIDPSIDIDAYTYEPHLIGYCVVHEDFFSERSGGRKEYSRQYVPECVVKIGNPKIRGQKRGTFDCDVIIDSEQFSIKNAFFFTQQNGLTDCCVHAAILMVMKNYDKDLTSHKINQILNERVGTKRNNVSHGLTIEELIYSVKAISSASEKIPKIEPIILSTGTLSIASFIESLHRAVESRLPVILLLRLPESTDFFAMSGGHAISLVGINTNNNNWCTYAGGYFARQEEIRHISNWLLCDYFIVQDDNFGPLYHLPVSFLSNYHEYSSASTKLSLNIPSGSMQIEEGNKFVLSAVIMVPEKTYDNAKLISNIEKISVKMFIDQIEKFGRSRDFKLNADQKKWFDLYFYHIFKYNSYRRSFTTRTILISKNEYIASCDENILAQKLGDLANVEECLKDLLPDYFWLTEISTPELYLNHFSKAGEIVVSAKNDKSSQLQLLLIRLPFFMAFYDTEKGMYHPVTLDEQIKRYHPIVKKKVDTFDQILNEERLQ